MLNFKPAEFLKLLREILAELRIVHAELNAIRLILGSGYDVTSHPDGDWYITCSYRAEDDD